MADVAFERLESVNMEHRAELLRIREQAVRAIDTPLFRFSSLPVEMQITIFECAIERENLRLLTLTHVCRRWREIIITRPLFWRHPVLTEKTTQEEVDIWLHRGGGLLSSIQIDEELSSLTLFDILRNAAPDMWSRLDSFKVQQMSRPCPELVAMLPEIISKLQVESLKLILGVSSLSSRLMKALYDMEASRLRCLSLLVGSQMTLACLSLPSLTNLELLGYVQTDDLLAFMGRHSRIGSLVLICDEIKPMNVNVSRRTVMLAGLKRLTLSGRWKEDAFCRSIIFPNLEMLKVFHVDGGEGWLKSITLQRLIQLKIITLRGESASPSTLIDFLRQAAAVRRLTLDFKIFNGTCEEGHAAIAALSERIPAKDGHGQSESLCCPRLQHLSVTAEGNSITRPLVQLVKVRLPRAALPSGIDPSPTVPNGHSQGDPLPLPIISLDLHLGKVMEPDSLKWLKGNVDQVSCAVL